MLLCSQQGVRCCLAWKCVFSGQPVPGGKMTASSSPHLRPIPGSHRLQGQTRADRSLHLCLFHIHPSVFPNVKEENGVVTVLFLPNGSSLRESSKASLPCPFWGWMKKKHVSAKSLAVVLQKCLRLFYLYFITSLSPTHIQMCIRW